MRPRRPYRRQLPAEPEHKINGRITAQQVRLVGDNIEPGVFSLREAMTKADDLELDLVEISPKADPPVCRILDYKKFIYEKKKKEKEIKAKTAKTVIKEVRFTPNTDDHDFDFKAKHAEKFLKEGAKVKIYVQFKGRGILFKERGELMLLKFAERLSEWGALEQMPKLEGRRMIAFVSPKLQKKK